RFKIVCVRYGARAMLRVLATIAFVASGLHVLSPLWIDRRPIDGQFAFGYFEEIDGVVRLAADREHGTTLPGSGLGNDGMLTVMPGSTVVLSLGEKTEYVIENEIAAI